jgi:methylated-DNA-[protein]-cysteine S-methyltransferase
MNTTMTWTQPSPFGRLVIRASKDGIEHIDIRNGKAQAVEPPPGARKISRAFERYFAGEARALDRLSIDLSGVQSDFQRNVLETLRQLVGPGATISYGELAAAVGHPGAARAVGTTMATNPVPIIVPCHRVLASNGKLGGYGGGLEMKRALLRLEGAWPAGP